MKKRVLLAFFCLVFLVLTWKEQYTRNSEKKNYATDLKQVDKELFQEAHGIFQPLPSRSESVDNPITQEKIKLGKLLYYDTRLSKNGNNSCNSCHNLATYGVDNSSTSKGDAGKFGNRNSPTVLNAALQEVQYWDGRTASLENQAGEPILNPLEMAIPSKEFLVKKLKKIKEYENLFKTAYPSDKEALSYTNIQRSIAAFERTLLTPSLFDNYLNGDTTVLSTDQKEGLKTFVDVGCIQCHNGVNVGGSSCQKFGVYGNYRIYTKSKTNDEGRKNQTLLNSDKDVFKVASLRNVTKTYPYFHDGSVMNLDKAVAIMGKTELNKNLTNVEVNNIVAFLNSLTGTVPEEAQISLKVLSLK